MTNDNDDPRQAPSAAVSVAINHLLDIATVPRVGVLLDEALARRPSEIVVDVAACQYVDAAGIALLLDLHRRSWRAGSRLTLRSPSPRLRRLLEIARVDHVLHVEPDPAPAGRRPAGDTEPAAGHHGNPGRISG